MRKFLWLFFLVLLSATTAHAAPIPRTIIALYDKDIYDIPKLSAIHQMAEMPLNHLGLKVVYHEIHEPLPDIAHDETIRGVLTWFSGDVEIGNPQEFLDWSVEAIQAGKKFVVLGDPAIDNSTNLTLEQRNQFWNLLGVEMLDDWVGQTYDAKVSYKDPKIVEFERKYGPDYTPWPVLQLIDEQAIPRLALTRSGQPSTLSHLVVTHPNGGYALVGYALRRDEQIEPEVRQWYINPFEFFRIAFATDDLPKPDTTTLAGRRIYYSHIDGDGWNNVTELEEYAGQQALSAQVILDKVIRPHPDLPISVAIIGAEIDPKWAAVESSRKVARDILALPQVEAATHTYSHPFHWGFFADNNPEKERPYLGRYPLPTWDRQTIWQKLFKVFKKEDASAAQELDVGPYSGYTIPRAYATEKFSVEQEVIESQKAVAELAPADKPVKILMWPGNTTPFAKAVEVATTAGMENINGGDTRFDREFNSYAWVAPVGRMVEGFLQVYASASNENTYTELWTSRFHGFQFLKQTLENTESPRRVKPINIYYHMYSGQKLASLNALLSNLDYALQQEITPIEASAFTKIVRGFYNTELEKIGAQKWKVKNRGQLNTVRFDRSSRQKIDWSQSRGIVGQQHFQGSLYIYLDSHEAESVIALTTHNDFGRAPTATRPYLIDSRWLVSKLQSQPTQFSFQTRGYGTGTMHWWVPHNGNWTVTARRADGSEVFQNDLFIAENNILIIHLPDDLAMDDLIVDISRGDQ